MHVIWGCLPAEILVDYRISIFAGRGAQQREKVFTGCQLVGILFYILFQKSKELLVPNKLPDILKKKRTVHLHARADAVFRLGDINSEKAYSAIIKLVEKGSEMEAVAGLLILRTMGRPEAIPAIMDRVFMDFLEPSEGNVALQALEGIVETEKARDPGLAKKLALVEKHIPLENYQTRTLLQAAVTGNKGIRRNIPTDLNDRKQRAKLEYFQNFKSEFEGKVDVKRLIEVLGIKGRKKGKK